MTAEKFEVIEIKQVIEAKVTSEPQAELAMNYEEYLQVCLEDGLAVRYSPEAWAELQRKGRS